MLDIINAIQEWMPLQPKWQWEALRRLYANRTLTPADEDELYGLMKSLRGIHCDNVAVVQQWSSVGDTARAPSEHVALIAITDVQHANALASDQRIEFQPDGLTVIYGDNGSGKSGYARVLKRACRARDNGEQILPDVNAPASSGKRASAAFLVRVGGAEKPLAWTDGQTSPTELLTLVVFDARCAQNYLGAHGASTFLPEGMDLMVGLVTLCDSLRARLRDELRTTVVDKVAYAQLATPSTTVGRTLAALSAASNVAALEAMAQLNAAEQAELAALAVAVKEANPKDKAQVLRLQTKRLLALAQRCNEQAQFVSDAAVQLLRQQVADSVATAQVASSAATLLTTRPGALPGTGNEAWREMLRAARTFVSETHAGHSLGRLAPDDACPLCQQTLGDAAAHLAAFDSFIEGAAEKAAQTARQTAVTTYTTMKSHPLDVGFDAATQSELTALNSGLRDAVVAFEGKLRQRRDAAVAACGTGGDWNTVPGMPQEVSSALNAQASQLTQQAEALEALADEARAKEVQLRHAELSDRTALAAVLPAVVAAVRCEQLRAKLASCDVDVQTTTITQQTGVLNQRILTSLLVASLNAEFQALGVGDLHVELSSKNVKGTTQYGLTLKRQSPCSPQTVLSEGEQRAVAIAAFLADLSLGGNRAGVIFDDPVSSLDHERRERVARRLVQEAKRRQVVILSHDLAFVSLLDRESKLEGVKVLMQALQRVGTQSGVKTKGAPVAGLSMSARIKGLNAACDEIDRLIKQNDENGAADKLRCTWVDLRLAWERGVEECLFNGVVERFDPGISTLRLDAVEFEDPDVREVFRGMTRCNTVPHDQAARLNPAPVSVAELRQEVERLKVWAKKVRDQGDKARTRRGLK